VYVNHRVTMTDVCHLPAHELVRLMLSRGAPTLLARLFDRLLGVSQRDIR
jgi:hypothetical protein